MLMVEITYSVTIVLAMMLALSIHFVMSFWEEPLPTAVLVLSFFLLVFFTFSMVLNFYYKIPEEIFDLPLILMIIAAIFGAMYHKVRNVFNSV